MKRRLAPAIALLVIGALLIDFLVLPFDDRSAGVSLVGAAMAALYLGAMLLAFRFERWQAVLTGVLAVAAAFLALPAYAYVADPRFFDVIITPRLLGLFLCGVVSTALIVQRRAGLEILRLNTELEGKVRARTDLYRKAAAAATRAQAQIDAIARVVLDGIVVSESGRIVSVNPAFVERLGYTLDEFIGATTLQFVAEHFRQAALNEFRTPSGQPYELLLVCRDGSTVLMETHSTLISDEGHELYLCGFRDISEKLALQRELADVSERERRRIGHELQEHLGQLLASARWAAESLAASSRGTHKAIEQDAQKIAGLVAECVADCRQISQRLAPRPLNGLGMRPMLEILKQSVESQSSIRCTLECPRSVLLDDDEVVLHLYRIAEEAVSNALRHSGGTQISLSFEHVGGHYVLTVADDGVGLPDESERREGAGLRGTRHRARLIDGFIDIETGVNGGTSVICTIPVARPAAQLRGATEIRRAAG